MKEKEFLVHYLQNRSDIDPPYTLSKMRKILHIKKLPKEIINKLERWKNLTEFINYGCKFNKKGICQYYRKDKDYTDNKSKMCCCGSCFRSGGWNELYNVDIDTIKKLAYHFNKNTGFWRENKGCILPRKLRSKTCLTYHCKNRTSKSDEIIFGAILDYSSALSHPNKIIRDKLINEYDEMYDKNLIKYEAKF